MTETKTPASAESAAAETAASTEPATDEAGGSTLGTLTGKGEEALRLLTEALEKNQRALQAKDRFSKFQRSTMQQLNIALADEVAELKEQVGRLEERLAKLEKGSKG
jgi:ubiquinone biosynthesis protein UbiJ